MSTIFGHLNLADSDRVFNSRAGQQAIFEAVGEYVRRGTEELNRQLSVFVARTGSNHKIRYKLPGNGYLQRRGPDGRYSAVKAHGGWDVAFPLEDLGAQIVGNDVALAYLTVEELERHVNTVVSQNVNSVRYAILAALFNNGPDIFVDPLWGVLVVEPLANDDGTLYPPVVGSDDEAEEDHYLVSGYAADAIDDDNDPYVTLTDDITHHFGVVSGGSGIVTFINPAQRAVTEALTAFTAIPDRYVQVGLQTAVPIGAPVVPGFILGRHGHGTWVSVWDRVPEGYMLTLSLEAEPPLIRRIDPADTGLGDGLQLVAEDTEFPFKSSIWRHRFGLGCGNRLNGAVMYFDAESPVYVVPAGY